MTILSITWMLAVGFVLGLKHATDPDHLAAVSTIVGDHKRLWSASIIGGLWGLGHTISLLIAGVFVIVIRVEISERLTTALEFGVALMLIGLGVNTLLKVARGGQLHWHVHRHGGITHAHPHIHSIVDAHQTSFSSEGQTHHRLKLGSRPLIIGMVHGLAGSGALMLLVLSTIQSSTIGVLYILTFGIGSIGGMMAMSTLLGLPYYMASSRGVGKELVFRGAAGVFSLCFGLFMAFEIGFAEGFFQ